MEATTSIPAAPHDTIPCPPLFASFEPTDADRRYVYRFAVSRLRDACEAEDVTQEALTRAVARPPREAKFLRSYVCRIVCNLIFDRRRAWRDLANVDDMVIAS